MPIVYDTAMNSCGDVQNDGDEKSQIRTGFSVAKFNTSNAQITVEQSIVFDW